MYLLWIHFVNVEYVHVYDVYVYVCICMLSVYSMRYNVLYIVSLILYIYICFESNVLVIS